jgi:hypothetical protein
MIMDGNHCFDYHSKYLNPSRSPPKYLPSHLYLVLLNAVKSMHLCPMVPICKFGPALLWFEYAILDLCMHFLDLCINF